MGRWKRRNQDAKRDDGRVAQRRHKLPRFPSIHLFVGITHSERRGGAEERWRQRCSRLATSPSSAAMTITHGPFKILWDSHHISTIPEVCRERSVKEGMPSYWQFREKR